MSKTEKLLLRLLSTPKDFTWGELTKLLKMFGFVELKKGKTVGSGRKFADQSKNVIIIHEPHPESIVKVWVVKEVIAKLKEIGYIKDE